MRPLGFEITRILDTAFELFWRRGSQVSIRELETSLGIAQSSIYNTFGSKDGLLEAALTHYESRLDKQLLSLLRDDREGLTAVDKFLSALDRWVREQGHRGCLLLNTAAEHGGANSAIKKRTTAYLRRLRKALYRALERAADAGEIEAGGGDWRANLLLTLILGFNIAARAGASHAELSRHMQAMRDQVNAWRETAPA